VIPCLKTLFIATHVIYETEKQNVVPGLVIQCIYQRIRGKETIVFLTTREGLETAKVMTMFLKLTENRKFDARLLVIL
jgi:hypothetical protein